MYLALDSAGFSPFRSSKVPLTGLPEIPHPFNIHNQCKKRKTWIWHQGQGKGH